MYPSELYHALKIARKEGYGGNTPDIPVTFIHKAKDKKNIYHIMSVSFNL